MPYRIRIKEYRIVKASELRANPLNWRIHPVGQTQAMDEVLQTIGFAGAVLARETPTGLELYDGHLRTGLAEMSGDSDIPVLITDLSDTEMRSVLASYDYLTTMIEVDPDKLRNLLDTDGLEIPDVIFDGLSFELEAQEQFDMSIGLPKEAIGGKASPLMLKPEARFPSSNVWGIPDLLPELLARAPEGIQTWLGPRGYSPDVPSWLFVFQNISRVKLDPKKSVLSFYTFDEKFEDVWRVPHIITQKILADGWKAVVSPNFSTFPDMPLIEKMWNCYRSRWAARYFQSVGLPVIPDLEWNDVSNIDYVVMGLPVGLPCVSIQLQTSVNNRNVRANRDGGVREVLKRLQPEQVMIYGCSPVERLHMSKIIPSSIEVIWLESITRGLKNVLNQPKEVEPDFAELEDSLLDEEAVGESE